MTRHCARSEGKGILRFWGSFEHFDLSRPFSALPRGTGQVDKGGIPDISHVQLDRPFTLSFTFARPILRVWIWPSSRRDTACTCHGHARDRWGLALPLPGPPALPGHGRQRSLARRIGAHVARIHRDIRSTGPVPVPHPGRPYAPWCYTGCPRGVYPCRPRPCTRGTCRHWGAAWGILGWSRRGVWLARVSHSHCVVRPSCRAHVPAGMSPRGTRTSYSRRPHSWRTCQIRYERSLVLMGSRAVRARRGCGAGRASRSIRRRGMPR